MKQKISRRGFLTGTLTASAVGPLVLPAAVLGRDGQLPPSERITIGVIGAGNRGRHSLDAMRPLPDHQVVAIAEARRDRGDSACQMAEEFYAERLGRASYSGCKLYSDFRDLLARDDIDAIWGTVPDHWHGCLYSRVIESGKDIYGEKPLSRWIAQGVKLKQMVRRYGTIFQVGLQQRSDPKFRLACNLARNGYLGKIAEVQVAVPGGTFIPAVAPCEPPAGFDWDMWTGPAPMFPFDPKRVEWLGLYMISHYCAGFITNWGVHHLDTAGWGLPEIFEKPFEASGRGVLPESGMADTWISWRMQLQYDSGLVLNFCNTGNPYEQGCRFIGDEGWVHIDRSGIKASDAKLLDITLRDTDIHLHVSPAWDDPYTAHTADFFRSMRTRTEPVCPLEQGHYATTLGNVCDISLRLGRKLKWDPQHDCFIGDDEANSMRSRAERSPWTM